MSLRLQSLNQKTLTDCTDAHGVFYTDSFFDFFLFDLSFDFLFDCTLTGQKGFQTDFSFDSVCILNDSFDSED